MIYRTERSLRFQPMWMMRKDFLTSPKDLLHRLGYWQRINGWSKLGTIELGFTKLSKEQEMTRYIAIHKASPWGQIKTRGGYFSHVEMKQAGSDGRKGTRGTERPGRGQGTTGLARHRTASAARKNLQSAAKQQAGCSYFSYENTLSWTNALA